MTLALDHLVIAARTIEEGLDWCEATLGLRPEAATDRHNIFEYRELVERMLARSQPSYKRFPCVTPMWDNAARRQQGAYIFRGSTPQLYEHWLEGVTRSWRPPSPGENLVFINAWNEWAEGNHLEPDLRWGREYLEATRRALRHAINPPETVNA